ncbi:MAG TPA: HAMP domain-containing sensor histidine kinase [Rubricoccaceae bacterium]|jgi:signal transduction histidine kinase
MTETTPLPRPDEPSEVAIARLRRVLDLSIALTTVGDIDQLLSDILDTVTTALGCEQAALLLADDATGGLRFAAATGRNRAALTHIRVPLDGSLAGAAFRDDRVVMAADPDARHFDAPAEAAGVEVRSLLAVPMRADGAPVGVLEALNARAGAFDAADVETLRVIAAQAAAAVRNATQQRALQQANRRLEALDRVRADFVTVASHELRTPLAAVQGYAQALADDDVENQREAIAEILAAARHMTDIVETLDELASPGDETGIADGLPVPLAEIVVGLGGPSDAAPRRTIDVVLPPEPLHVAGDARRLRLAFQHLLDNADAFTPPEGRVWIDAEAGDGRVTVRVCDTGRGLAADDLERIFEPFVQAEAPDTRSREGLGVGLALARSVVLRHGGRLWATSAGPGRGSTFHVRLPLAAA